MSKHVRCEIFVQPLIKKHTLDEENGVCFCVTLFKVYQYGNHFATTRGLLYILYFTFSVLSLSNIDSFSVQFVHITSQFQYLRDNFLLIIAIVT